MCAVSFELESIGIYKVKIFSINIIIFGVFHISPAGLALKISYNTWEKHMYSVETHEKVGEMHL